MTQIMFQKVCYSFLMPSWDSLAILEHEDCLKLSQRLLNISYHCDETIESKMQSESLRVTILLRIVGAISAACFAICKS